MAIWSSAETTVQKRRTFIEEARRPAEFIKERVGRHKTALEKLHAYIESNFDLMEAHRNNYVALVDLWGRRSDSMGHTLLNVEAYELSRHYLARILEEERERGELRPLPVQTTASSCNGSLTRTLSTSTCAVPISSP